MGFFLETLLGGLMAGMLYSLIALGFVLIFKASRRLQLRAGRDGAVRGAGDGALLRMDPAAGPASRASCSPTSLAFVAAWRVMIARGLADRAAGARQAGQPGRHHAADGHARHRLLPRRLRPDHLRQRHLQDRRRHAEGPDVPVRDTFPGRRAGQQGRPVSPRSIAAALVAAAVAVLPEDRHRPRAARGGRRPPGGAVDRHPARRASGSSSGAWPASSALVAGIIWGSKLGVQFSLVAGGAEGAAGGDPRRPHLGARRDHRRADHRRRREAVRGLPRPACSAAASRSGSPTCWRWCSCWSGRRGCSARRSSIGSEERTCSTAKTASSRPATAPTSRSSRSCRTASRSALLLAFAFVAVPLLASEYLFRAILIPFLILSLAALGLNILVGYCGQISLGTGAFMAVGAYAAYNFHVRIDGMPLIAALLLGGAVRHRRRRAVRHPVAAHQGPVPRGGDAGGAVLRRLGVPAHQVVHQRLVVGLGQRRPTCRCSACRSRRRCRSTCSAWPSLVRVRAAGQEPGARRTSAASGWRSATWTWPPR